MSLPTRYRLKPNVVVHDCDWLEEGQVYEGAVVTVQPVRDPPEVELFHPRGGKPCLISILALEVVRDGA